ncbi:MAG: nitroreductase [Clostridiales bacterium]|nr:nitroreductase [Clostridiales bacterium]MBD8942683.1 nitroreductase [Clostridiales bacterium]
MEAIECIKTRRSIRKYEDKPVDKSLIEEIIEVTRFAPSWKNSQTVRYIAIYDKDIKTKIAEECIMGHAGNKNNIMGAPVLMVEVTVNKRAGYERDGSHSTSKKDHWQSYDAGMSAEVFCLAAHEKGLGTVVMGIYEEAKVKEVLGIGEDKSVSALIALGYPADAPAAPKRKEVADILTFM